MSDWSALCERRVALPVGHADAGPDDVLTTGRACENLVNAVTVKARHYGYGGLWTPKRHHSRELAHMRASLSVIVDVRVPVKGLFRQQRLGVGEAERLPRAEWLGESREGEEEFKVPPLGFERCAFSTNTGPEGD